MDAFEYGCAHLRGVVVADGAYPVTEYVVGVRRGDRDPEELAGFNAASRVRDALEFFSSVPEFSEVTGYFAVTREAIVRAYRDPESFRPVTGGNVGEPADFRTALETVSLHGHGSVLNSRAEPVYIALPGGERYVHGWRVQDDNPRFTLRRLVDCLVNGRDLVKERRVDR